MAAGRVPPPSPRHHQQPDGGGGGGGPGGEDESVLRLRWNSHVESLQQLFEGLLEQQLFVDVTLACDGGCLKAHRVMLSACSAYFRRVLNETTSKCPVIIMRDVPAAEMDFILQFIYRGEIHVPELRLPSLLKTARLLEIRGLSDKLDGSSSSIGTDGVDQVDHGAVKEPDNATSKPESRKRRSSSDGSITNGHGKNGNGVNHNSPPPHSPRIKEDPGCNAKRSSTQVPIKEEESDEEMDSDCDATQSTINQLGNGDANSTMEERASPSLPPLDLSNGDGASDEENEVPCGDRKNGHGHHQRHSGPSPVPLMIKCEAMQQELVATEEDDEDEDDLLDEEEEETAALMLNGASFPFSSSGAEQPSHQQSGSTAGGGGVVQAVCPFCFKDCKRTAELRAHIRAHTGEKPFRCDICSAPFARSAHLKRHRRVHTGERPFECHRCQKTFSRQDKLKLHMDRHRLRDTGGSKMIVGRPKKLASSSKTASNGHKNGDDMASTSSSTSTPTSSSTASMSSEAGMSGMGQFAFPGAPARPSATSSTSQSPSSSSSGPYGDLNYFSLLSLSQRGLTISPASSSSSSGPLDLQHPPSPTVPHLLSPQALQELQLFRQRGRPPRSRTAHRTGRNGGGGGHHQESASETLLNFAQQVVEVVAAPSPTMTP